MSGGSASRGTQLLRSSVTACQLAKAQGRSKGSAFAHARLRLPTATARGVPALRKRDAPGHLITRSRSTRRRRVTIRDAPRRLGRVCWPNHFEVCRMFPFP